MLEENSFHSIYEKDLNQGDDGSWKLKDKDPPNLDYILKTI